MASSRAVRPLDCVKVSRFWITSKLRVNPDIISGRSLNCTRKNSSSGLAVLKNWATASRALLILCPMLPLASKTIPSEIGASSAPNCVISWSILSSVRLKCPFSRPVTSRAIGSVTVTLISTSGTSTLIVAVRCPGPESSSESAGRDLRSTLASAPKAATAQASQQPAANPTFFDFEDDREDGRPVAF